MNQKLIDSFTKCEKALNSLTVILDKPMEEDRSNIDAAIHRFEFSIELYWKLLKRILETRGVDVLYPKDVLRAAYAGKMINHEEVWLNMLNDRNITSHTYDETLADQVFQRIFGYSQTMNDNFVLLKTQFGKNLDETTL